MSVWDALTASRAARALAAQMASRQIPHAWLLVGPRGAGKRAAALAMACSVNCATAPGEGCGTCSHCARILRRRHPDVHHIEPEGPLIPVDAIREAVIPEAARSPFEAAFKIFVIEEADRMNDAAQNALLKTLEEPQPDTIFILVSEREEDLLETITSRCRTIRLQAIAAEAIVAMLVREGADEETAAVATTLSEGDMESARSIAFDPMVRVRRSLWLSIPPRLGSPGDALDIAEEVVAAARDAARSRERAQKEEVAELAEALGEGRGTTAARNALAKRHRRELRRVEEEVLAEALVTLASFYRDVVALRSGAEAALTNVDAISELTRWAESDLNDARFVAAAERCMIARDALTKNANALLAVEAALLDVGTLVPPPRSAAA